MPILSSRDIFYRERYLVAKSTFIANKTINPLRYLVSFYNGLVYNYILKLITRKGIMRIKNL